MPSFDLVREPWVPVRYVHGFSGPPEVGLEGLFARADEIEDVTVPVPPSASGLWRVLYLIAARVTGLGDPDAGGMSAWRRERARVLAGGGFDQAAVTGYFGAHAGGFDLFDPVRPWLQDARLAAECAESSGVNSLAVDRASGNNPVWLSHATDLDPRPVRAADAAWYLLAWLYYGRSGNTISRTVDGRPAFNMTAGPLRSRLSFHPLGRNLFESLITGIPYPGGHDENYLAPDLAPWEDPAASDPLGNPPARRGLSGVLAGRFRHALLLTPSADGTQVTDVRITWAWRLPHSPSEDPYLIYETSKGKPVASARRADLDRAVWRDLDALMLQETGSGATRRPAVFANLLDGALLDITGPLRVRVFGFDQDGQTRDRQWFTAVTPPVLAVDESDGDGAYRYSYEIGEAREAAERVEADLRLALRRAWNALGSPQETRRQLRARDPDGPWVGPALGRYWTAAEAAFWRMLDHLEEFDFPHNRFIRLGLSAYEQVTDTYAGRSVRAARVLERSRGGLFATWSRDEPSPMEDPGA